ncbi:MAG: glycosyltransferase family 2 protein [Anaerolineae bacterium]|nr:glycosyltransferase family 2 protein [Anaerolineae bacterium]
MSPDAMVSIVIVNYNAGELLHRCLASIARQTCPNWEVIIVDNASQDESLQCVEQFGRVRVIRNSKNVGFATAQNQGLGLAQGCYLMPLNFDIEMTPRFLDEMVAAMELAPTIGIVTGKLMTMSTDGRHLDTFYSTGHVMPPNGYALHRGEGERDQGQYDDMGEVFGAPGAAPLYRREMLADIAFRGQIFDESLFTWYEDVDLDWRAQRLGWKCVYTPTAVAYHVGHPEGHGGNLWQLAISIRNRWLVVLANSDFSTSTVSALLRYELSLIRYVVRNGYLSAYVNAWKQFLGLMHTAVEKRRWTMQRARARNSAGQTTGLFEHLAS